MKEKSEGRRIDREIEKKASLHRTIRSDSFSRHIRCIERIVINGRIYSTEANNGNNTETYRPEWRMVLNLIRSDFRKASAAASGARVWLVPSDVEHTFPFALGHSESHEILVLAFSIFDEDIFGRRKAETEYSLHRSTLLSAHQSDRQCCSVLR